jgi:DNA invertase Pin-like site-specific DNA recombinase
MQNNITYTAGLYLRLSKDDEQAGESVSIGTQRAILLDFCQQEGYAIHDIYIDDGYSGLNFNRPGFQRMIEDIEKGKINLVITKDLSRLGRDYIMTGYYSEIYFQMKDVRYIALADDVDTLKGHNEIAPFKNILNDMYARDISKKVKNAKHQRAKLGLHIGAQPSYGYKKDPDTPGHLIVDPDAAEVIRTIYSLALQGLGNVAIAAELTKRHIVTPSYYKFQQGDIRFSHYPSVKNGDPYTWSHGTIYQILNNPVYTGTLISLKTETTDCKTKRRICVPADQQIITENAHVAIVTQEQFEAVKLARADHVCLANLRRENIFRGKLFCECCGHPLVISRKQLKERTADIYLCMYHYTHRDVCPRTHRVYHDMLYPYVLQEIQAFARSMKRRKVNSPIKDYANIQELTPEILDATIERIEISHVNYHSKPGSVIHIYWKLK